LDKSRAARAIQSLKRKFHIITLNQQMSKGPSTVIITIITTIIINIIIIIIIIIL
jgi:hypothetical protein